MTNVKGESSLPITITRDVKTLTRVSGLGEKLRPLFGGPIADIIHVLLAGTIRLNASDIHIEAAEKGAVVRLRVDGVLHDALFLPPKVHKPLLSRIKLLSGVKLNITDRPQDGRFSITQGGDTLPIEVRVSVIPAEYGEAVVARILNPQNLFHLEELGLRPDLLRMFQKEIKKPNGMIIVTGPTGSGKTTTLYAFLKSIQNPEIKIITIEDPIEYHLEGVEQTQVSKKYDFANGLQAIVRQDPDVILVGEIRDDKTCAISLQAALTGHLVFTTLHTNNALGTIPRLLALGGEAHNIGPALNVAVAQRLVRRVCTACAQKTSLSASQAEKIRKELPSSFADIKIPAVKTGTVIPKTKGCDRCGGTGYKGRVGIFEAFLVDKEMGRLIEKEHTAADLEELAKKKGMTTMRQGGLLKVLEGITTLEEINRVTAE